MTRSGEPAVSAGDAAAVAADLAARRRSYLLSELTEQTVAADWLVQLRDWYREATESPYIAEPNAIQVATVDEQGRPDVRTVLARAFDESGVVFYTHYESAKGRQLAATAYGALVFAWLPLERQVRIRGPVSRVSPAETAEYFASRPREAQIGAWASPQSAVIADREELARLVSQVEQRFADRPVEPPPFWGGYRLGVDEIEFWQGREFRLHDRLRFSRQAGDWQLDRLAP